MLASYGALTTALSSTPIIACRLFDSFKARVTNLDTNTNHSSSRKGILLCVYGWASRALAKRMPSQTPELKIELRKGIQCVVFGPTVQATQHLMWRSTDNLNYANRFSPMWSQRGAPPLPHILGSLGRNKTGGELYPKVVVDNGARRNPWINFG
jgi:hypothetical protein